MFSIAKIIFAVSSDRSPNIYANHIFLIDNKIFTNKIFDKFLLFYFDGWKINGSILGSVYGFYELQRSISERKLSEEFHQARSDSLEISDPCKAGYGRNSKGYMKSSVKLVLFMSEDTFKLSGKKGKEANNL